ncbi:hypothetical protein [Azohydromonas aeria]|nr:hypothetical protein [Azohydromonas aeria]
MEGSRRCHALGVRCVRMRPNVMQGVRRWGEDWDPVWSVLQALANAA